VTAPKLDAFVSIGPARFNYVKRVVVEKTFDVHDRPSCTLRIELATRVPFSGPILHITFLDAVDIKIGDLNHHWCVLLSIRDISDHQLERIRYRVNDEESAVLSLYCSDFDLHIENADRRAQCVLGAAVRRGATRAP
jgi:hypothetical protein